MKWTSYVNGTEMWGSLGLMGEENMMCAVVVNASDESEAASELVKDSPWLETSLPITGGLSVGSEKSMARR
jgi:hypothetical protein